MTYDEKRARAQLEEILARNQKKTRVLAGEIADAVLARYKDTSIPTAQILSEVFREKDVTGRMRKIVGPAVVQSVAAGYGILPSVGFQPPQAAVDLAMSKQWDPTGMPTLSAQLYGTSQAYRLELEDALRKSFAQAKSVQQAARAIYDGYQPGLARSGPFAAVIHSAGTPRPQLPQVIRDGVDAASILDPADKIRLKKYASAVMAHAEDLKSPALKAAYMRLARQLETSGSRGLDRAVRVATEEKARYHADRIARTESVRAWDASFRARINDDPRVVGVRSRTSSAHKIFDICDFYATADLYGMGPGCYPKDRAPACPYHPHCTCNRTPIYRKRPSEAPPRAGGPDIDAGARALKGMSESDRRQLLGIHGAKAFAANPGSWTGSMRHWSGPGGPDPALAAAKAVVQAITPALPAQATPPPAFVEPTTVEEAMAQIRGLGMEADLAGMTLDHAQGVSKALHRMIVVEGMPAPKGVTLNRFIGGGMIKTATEDSTIMLGKEATRPGGWEQSRKQVNDEEFLRWERWQKLSPEQRKALLARGEEAPSKRAFVTERIHDTVIHEFGHFIHSLTWNRSVDALQSDILGFKELVGYEPAPGRKFFNGPRPVPTPKRARELRESLSEYATTNVLEVFAEAFNAKYSKGEKLPEELDRVITTAVEHAKRAGKVGP